MDIKPIAYISTQFKEKFGIPRQSGRIQSATGTIRFVKEYDDPQAIRGLENFSHIWLIWDFTENHRKDFSPTVRPPRLGGNERIGVFASRSSFRPNNLALSVVKIEKISGTEITVSGVDMLDGTPIYDIKPYIPYADSISGACGSYAETNKTHKLKVEDPNNALDNIGILLGETVRALIADDPRPSYQSDSRNYGMRYGEFDIHFTVSGSTATITDVRKISHGS